MSQINYIIDSNFHPYSFEERIKPYLLYKQEYDKTEAAYDDLVQKADTFNYLADKLKDDPTNKAAQIYKGYADELNRQAEDLARNGLTITNKRALMGLKRRYQGEIGQLVRADERMKEVQKKRDALQAAGKQMFYGTTNLDINDFLGEGNQFNGYAIDADELKKEAQQYAQSASSRLYSSDLVNSTNQYYLQQIEEYGYSPERMNAWRNNLESIPEFQQAVEDIISSKGIDTNLKGKDYEDAVQTIVNGVMEGSVYKESRKYERNPAKLTPDQEADNARAERALELQEFNSGAKWNPDTKTYSVDESRPDRDVNWDNWEMSPNGKWVRKPKPTKPKIEDNPMLSKEAASVIKNNGSTGDGKMLVRDETGHITTAAIGLNKTDKYMPFYADSWYDDAVYGLDVLKGKGGFDQEEAKKNPPYSMDKLRSDKAKEQVREYLRNLPLPLFDLTDAQLDKVISYMDFQVDYDWGSDNHYRLRVPGVNEVGTIVDKPAFINFIGKVNRLKMQAYTSSATKETNSGTDDGKEDEDFTISESELEETEHDDI